MTRGFRPITHLRHVGLAIPSHQHAAAFYTNVWDLIPDRERLAGQGSDDGWESFRALIPLGRLETTDDMVAFDKARHITGSAFKVDAELLLA